MPQVEIMITGLDIEGSGYDAQSWHTLTVSVDNEHDLYNDIYTELALESARDHHQTEVYSFDAMLIKRNDDWDPLS
jgi:hypothetical protein